MKLFSLSSMLTLLLQVHMCPWGTHVVSMWCLHDTNATYLHKCTEHVYCSMDDTVLVPLQCFYYFHTNSFSKSKKKKETGSLTSKIFLHKWIGVQLLQHLNQWRSQGLPGWASRPPERRKWGRKWRKFEEKWEQIQKNEERLSKCSYLAHLGVRGWLRPWSKLTFLWVSQTSDITFFNVFFLTELWNPAWILFSTSHQALFLGGVLWSQI